MVVQQSGFQELIGSHVAIDAFDKSCDVRSRAPSQDKPTYRGRRASRPNTHCPQGARVPLRPCSWEQPNAGSVDLAWRGPNLPRRKPRCPYPPGIRVAGPSTPSGQYERTPVRVLGPADKSTTDLARKSSLRGARFGSDPLRQNPLCETLFRAIGPCEDFCIPLGGEQCLR